MSRTYKYTLGYAIDGTPIPDPAGFGGEDADVDSSAERDLTGLLHREYVTDKHSESMEYQNIGWDMVGTILGLMKQNPQFEFTYPDPNSGTTRTMTAYVGNRKWDAVWMPENGDWYANLSFSVIEY